MKPEPLPLSSRVPALEIDALFDVDVHNGRGNTRDCTDHGARIGIEQERNRPGLLRPRRRPCSLPMEHQSPSRLRENPSGQTFSLVRESIVIVKFRIAKPTVNYTSFRSIYTFSDVTLSLHVNGNCFTHERAKSVLRPFRPGCAVSVPARA